MTMLSFIIFAIFLTFVSSNNENDVVRIINSGSTNTAGYEIVLQRSGLVTWTVNRRFRPVELETSSTSTPQNHIRIPTNRATKIFQEVEQAAPFSQYKPAFCIKSVSFGTRLYVNYNGQDSPDLSCPVTDERLVVLSKSIQVLIGDLHINVFG